jgi:hypothetical protein
MISGRICGVKHSYTDYLGYERQVFCNGQSGHVGEHSSHHDCCGDRYSVYVTHRHCEFCDRNEGWCQSCLEEHERKCSREQIKSLKKQLAAKVREHEIV